VQAVIYQCYFSAEQTTRLLQHEAYRGFGLEPAVHPEITRGCPELDCERTRTALTEYAAFLHIWRNLPYDEDDWIGFTSYRQLDKTDFVFGCKVHIEALLQGCDFLAWYWWEVQHVRLGLLTGAAAQAEISHPRLHDFTVDVLGKFGIALPSGYFSEPAVPFANYWVLRKPQFAAYMDWSWPLVRHALAIDHPYKRYAQSWNRLDDKRKAVAYFTERLFVIWTLIGGFRGRRLGSLRRA
jgi:hypothetical protein